MNKVGFPLNLALKSKSIFIFQKMTREGLSSEKNEKEDKRQQESGIETKRKR